MTVAPGLDRPLRGWRVARFHALDSTNEEARRRALAGDDGRLWIVADEQSAGRGRRGRVWVSPPGNLHASALLIDPCPPALAPQLGFVAGVALARAATEAGAARLGLKWPNDLMLNGVKCAGILVEGFGLPGGRAGYAVGIGVNCAQAPDGLGYATSRLMASGGREVGAGELFHRLVHQFDQALFTWRAGQAFDRVRAEWLEHAIGLGEPVTIESGVSRRGGVFAGIDPLGRLLMRSERGVESIEAADLALSPLPAAKSPATLPAFHPREGRAG